MTPNTPASLAVGPGGDLYVIDSGRDQILRRLPDGKFQVVAGNGKQGFSGDGHSALHARLRLQYFSGLAIARNGTVYFSDSGNLRVRAILPGGMIETVAGGGTKPIGREPIAADAAQLAPNRRYSNDLAGLAIGPGDELYLGLQTGVYRLTPTHMLVHVIGSQVNSKKLTAWDANPGNPEDFLDVTRLAFDRAGDLFVVGGGGAWGMYERTETGTLRFVHILRGVDQGAGGGAGSIASDPRGQVVSQAGFDGDFYARVLPSGKEVVCHAYKEISEGAGRAGCAPGDRVRTAGRACRRRAWVAGGDATQEGASG